MGHRSKTWGWEDEQEPTVLRSLSEVKTQLVGDGWHAGGREADGVSNHKIPAYDLLVT